MNKKSSLYNFKKLSEVEHPENFAKEIMELFLHNAPAETKRLVKMCREKNWEQVYFIAHKMKATVDLLNIERIKHEIRAVEKCAKAKIHLDEMDEKVNFINNTIQQCAKEMKRNFF
jgi:hypothetical protein